MIKYYTLVVHGYTDYIGQGSQGEYYIPGMEKGKRVWAKTVIAPDRIKRMKEVTMLDMIANANKKAK